MVEKEKIMRQIIELESEIALLPQGSITKKVINNKEYYYHRINKGGKRIENYISFEQVEPLQAQIKQRKSLEKKLKELKAKVKIKENIKEQSLEFRTMVRIGSSLNKQIMTINNYKKRECISVLRDYVFGEYQDKVLILYGLRRSGKTTMIRQIIGELSPDEFNKAAFIQVSRKDTLTDINRDLKLLEEKGYKYVFIDEVTLLEDFVQGAALFSDIYASSGMKLVLSGTDSLGFVFAKEEQLYDRCIMLHTTFIPYREFEYVLGIKGIDEYIRYGGTMSLSGINYNNIFNDSKSTEEYIDTAIAKNIQHSLEMYQYGGHFRYLQNLYECGELTNVINRVVENINHSFTKSVVEKTFKSHDISVTAANLLRDRDNPINIKEHMDLEKVTKGMMHVLDIINKENQTVDIDNAHMIQIKEYLKLLELIIEVDLAFLPDVSKKSTITLITQPGMRYAQASAIVENMLLDSQFQELSAKERKYILDRLLSEIKGRMMEDIVLLETKIANPSKQVFKLQFSVGEFDMVVFDPQQLNCEIYEVKYSKECVPLQYRHLKDEEKCKMTSFRYGDIINRYVIYRGESLNVDGIQYLNVEEYLKSLK